ncbi:protein takeout [Stomoxys calcitrans]|uniref:protein takeout n=1 Tax=Stomoxys calcitrans TaxID=35570 RepID=UPI0027E286F6|nr:protein takeout [Stomoxys calcitrans]
MRIQNQIGFLVLIAVAATGVNADKYLAEKPDFLTPCKQTDPGFNRCFAKNFQSSFTNWNDGLPGLKSLGSFDPLHVKSVTIAEDGSGPVSINIGLTNLVLTGLKHTTVDDASFNPTKLITKVKFTVPKVQIDADYKVKGRVLTLPLDGNGKAKIVIEKLKMEVAVRLKLRKEDGALFTDVEKTRLEIHEVGGFQLRLDNLFNGQKVLEETATSLFNDNWRDLYEVMKPSISATVQTVMNDRFSKIFHYVPVTYYISDIEE